tara:strand:+ start:57826 stop:58224 length:399 start_codon:yes stop_codon:yes gene_type:complete
VGGVVKFIWKMGKVYGYIRVKVGDKAVIGEEEGRRKILDDWAMENGEVFEKIIVESCNVKDIKMVDILLEQMEEDDIFVISDLSQVASDIHAEIIFIEKRLNKNVRVIFIHDRPDSITWKDRMEIAAFGTLS